jgi:hypothetical protein
VPLAKAPAAYAVALGVVALIGIAGVVWWAWFVSRGLAVAYAEGFGEVGPSEE